MSNFLRSFPTRETQQVSCSYVGRIRDGMAEVVKDLSLEEVSKAVRLASPSSLHRPNGRIESVPFFQHHVQDEAEMQLRSSEASLDSGSFKRAALRARSSKVQCNCIHVSPKGSAPLEVYTDLQPLSRKNADTIAAAIIKATVPIFHRLQTTPNQNQCTQIRLLHVVPGDGIPTNQAALRRVCAHFMARGSDTSSGITNTVRQTDRKVRVM